ncbi:MAG: FAD-dependent oxidoreductase, partial [Candidatus Cryptobacteroides sp.]
MEHSDIIIIGAGAAGLMAAVGAAGKGSGSVTVLEKMPRPGRKIMITGKGRCNFTNVKDWNDFSRHIHPKPNLLKPSFYNLTPAALGEFLNRNGL